jgi:Fe-S oxidoreductase
MLTLVEKLIFTVLVLATIYNGYWAFYKVYLVIKRGQGDYDDENILPRAWRALVDWLTLRPIWKTRPVSSVFHAMVAWGFTFYFLVNFGDVLQGYFPIKFMGTGVIGNIYRLLADIFSVSVIIGMSYFLVRRFLIHDPHLVFRDNIKVMEKVKRGGIQKDSLIVGLFILFHVGFRFLGESFTVAHEGGDVWQPFATAVSQLWAGLPDYTLVFWQHASWWIALSLILAFIPYFPHSKHFHLFMAGFNFLAKPQRPSLSAMEPIDFEDESIEQFGVAKLTDLTWKGILDPYACIMCNRCQDACPAYVTGKELSPSALEVNKRYFINDHVDELASGGQCEINLLDFALTESALWACTSCGACVEVCPVGNEPMFDIMYMRQNQVLMESDFPAELQTAFTGMERTGNPWKLSASDRMNWADGLDIPTVEDNPDFDVLWWVGCAPAYDMRAQSTAKAFAKILNEAGVNFAVLGEREMCCGDSARRAGNEYLFFELATQNVETLNEVKAKKIITTCPHGLNTLGAEYGAFGGDYEVIHHSQMIEELLKEGKIRPKKELDETVTFHDPCYLGRHNGVYDAPRDVLTFAVTETVEMEHNRNLSFCCGAGGAQMWKEEEHGDEAVNMRRYEEAVETGASCIAVGCPFCLTMLTDASKEAGEDGLEVKDIAELVAETL